MFPYSSSQRSRPRAANAPYRMFRAFRRSGSGPLLRAHDNMHRDHERRSKCVLALSCRVFRGLSQRRFVRLTCSVGVFRLGFHISICSGRPTYAVALCIIVRIMDRISCSSVWSLSGQTDHGWWYKGIFQIGWWGGQRMHC